MTKSDLVKIIRTVVREEVDAALPQLLMEVLAEKITTNPANLTEQRSNTQVIYQKPQTPARQPAPVRRRPLVEFETPIKQPPVQIFSGNTKFADALNSTVGGIPEEGMPGNESVLDSVGRETPVNEAVAGVHAVLNRDFSKVLKAVEAKANRRLS